MFISYDTLPNKSLQAAGNAGWPFQFRFAVHAGWSRVPELWTLGGIACASKISMSRNKISIMAFAYRLVD